jgi:hypothetical protein
VASFAVMLRSRPATPEGILLMVDERRDAEEIAVELRRKGHQVDVREIVTSPGAESPWTARSGPEELE